MVNVVGLLVRGIVAGFIATCVLSALMLTKGWLPQLDLVTVMDGIAHDLALAAGLSTPFAGWMWHFVVGTLVWGWMYAVMEPIIPGRRTWQKGLYFGLTATLLVWFMVLPMAGAGMFGLRLNALQPFVSLAQQVIYGVTLSVVFDLLPHSGPRSR